MRRQRWRGLFQVVAMLAVLFAVADAFRWGNRWYVSTMFDGPGDAAYALDILTKAHDALVHGLVWLFVALVAGAIGWRVRVTRAREIGPGHIPPRGRTAMVRPCRRRAPTRP